MRVRTLISSMAAGAVMMVGSAHAQSTGPGPDPFPICNGFLNDDFSIGSAFWSVDIETGEFGRTGTGVFTEFDNLSIVPSSWENVATFFTEALAQADHEFPLGSAANSTTFFRRQFPAAPNGVLRFNWGGQLSYVLIGPNTSVQWNVTLVVRNITDGTEAKCRVASGRETVNFGSVNEEGIIDLGVNLFDPCACSGLLALNTSGDTIEVQLIGTVRADAPDRGFQSAFIGGPLFYDNFEFCNIACPVPSDDDVLPAFRVQSSSFDLMPGESMDEALQRKLDVNGDGEIDQLDMMERINRSSVPTDLDGDGRTTAADLDLVIANVGSGAEDLAGADVNRDGVVDSNDMLEVIEALGG